MKNAFCLLAVLMPFFYACKNNPAPVSSSKPRHDSVPPPADFFPVSEYIGGELKLVDSLKPSLTLTVITGKKEHTGVTSPANLRKWAQNFREPDISSAPFKALYHETSIADQSIPSVTLIYEATNDTLTVRKINVFIKPDPVDNDKIGGVYIEKAFSRNDTLINQKLYWKTGNNMQVITEKKINAAFLPVEQVKISWNSKAN